jgi:hypothetical protein
MPEKEKPLPPISQKDLPADKQLTEQLDFIYKVTMDIEKVTKQII